MSQRQLVLGIAPEATRDFTSFVTGENAELIAQLRALACGRSVTSGKPDAVLYLWGEAGCGRSHLLAAVEREAGKTGHTGNITNLPRLTFADDVDRLDDAAQIALFNRINEARESGGTVLAAGPVPPAQLALREDLRTRLGWGLVYQVKPLSDEQRAVYLREEAARRGLRIGDEVIWYLLSHVRRDLPALVALMDHLDRYSLAAQRPLTLPLVRAALAEHGAPA